MVLFCAIIANLFLMIGFAPHKHWNFFFWRGWERGMWSLACGVGTEKHGENGKDGKWRQGLVKEKT
jgi:hypothetical protein